MIHYEDEVVLVSFCEPAVGLTGDFFTNCAIMFFIPVETSSFFGLSFFAFLLVTVPNESIFVTAAFFFGFDFGSGFVFVGDFLFFEADAGAFVFLLLAFLFFAVLVDLALPLPLGEFFDLFFSLFGKTFSGTELS